LTTRNNYPKQQDTSFYLIAKKKPHRQSRCGSNLELLKNYKLEDQLHREL
jgi:hypothetical protein